MPEMEASERMGSERYRVATVPDMFEIHHGVLWHLEKATYFVMPIAAQAKRGSFDQDFCSFSAGVYNPE